MIFSAASASAFFTLSSRAALAEVESEAAATLATASFFSEEVGGGYAKAEGGAPHLKCHCGRGAGRLSELRMGRVGGAGRVEA